MVPHLALSKAVNEVVGIRAGFCNGRLIPKYWSGWHHHLTLFVPLKINSRLNLFLHSKQYLFLCSYMSHCCYSSHLSSRNLRCLSAVSLVYQLVSSSSEEVVSYHWAVIACISLLNSWKVRLHWRDIQSLHSAATSSLYFSVVTNT